MNRAHTRAMFWQSNPMSSTTKSSSKAATIKNTGNRKIVEVFRKLGLAPDQHALYNPYMGNQQPNTSNAPRYIARISDCSKINA
jgi:hypothetical protein